ncbi:MAG: T9SS type A sorting domain-containing protein [Bacteroidota bacterium]|nr:T9SS type A sorting domain-containing protein [Bacteroidota bacterium]
MKKIYLLFGLLFLLFISASQSAILYSRANGGWFSNGTWSAASFNGVSCNCIPGNNDIIIIGNNNTVTFSANITIGSGGGNPANVTVNAGAFLTGNGTSDIEVKTGGVLNISGTVTTRNISFANGSTVNITSTGNLIVTGNLTNNNNSDGITINGTVSVAGNFFNGNGGVIEGSGSLSVDGSVTNNGTTFGCSGSGCCTTSPCTFGSVLPIELLSFQAIIQDNIVVLEWKTASEINNDFFTIEKTTNGKEFIEVIKEKGAGNSNTILTYTIKDENPFSGLSYYRLKQTDFDEKYSYSDLVSVKFDKKESASVNVYPNPLQSGSMLNVKIAGEIDKEVLIVVVDMAGKEHFSKVVVLDSNESVIAIDPNEKLSPGVYLITGSVDNNLYNRKLVVK